MGRMNNTLSFSGMSSTQSCINDSQPNGSTCCSNITEASTRQDENWVVGFTEAVEVVVIPVIVLVGFCGNLMSAIIFLKPALRQTSCCIYLAARAIADIGFLICLFLIWLPKVGSEVLLVTGICQLVVFVSYLTAFLSAWFVVWLTMENFYRICRPFRMNVFCTTMKAKLVISFTTAVGCAIYSVSLATNQVAETNGSKECSWDNKYQTINKIVSYGDTVVTFVFPFVVIAVTLVRTGWFVLSRCNQTKRRNSHSSLELQSQMTRLLFVVSTVFLSLSLPSYIIRVRLVVYSIMGGSKKTSPPDYLLQRIFQQLYYTTFAVNFFIYFGYATAFRKNCLDLSRLTGTFQADQVTKHDVSSQVDRVELTNININEANVTQM